MYTDSIIRIKNALERKKERIKVPYSRLDESILESLARHDYLKEVLKKGRGVKKIIEVRLKYDEDEKPAISGIKLLSRPSRRLYVGWKDIKRSHQGYGHFFFSTSKGIMSDHEARKNRVGGELLFEVW